MYTALDINAAESIYIPCGYTASVYIRSTVPGVGWKERSDGDTPRRAGAPLQKRPDAFMLALVNRDNARADLIGHAGNYIDAGTTKQSITNQSDRVLRTRFTAQRRTL